MTIDSRRAVMVLLAMGLSTVASRTSDAAPSARGYTGPGAVNETPPSASPTSPPAEAPPAEAPPAEAPPAEAPPAEAPPAETPPAETPPKKADPVAPADPEDEAWDGGFDVVDLTEDKEALKKELEVKTVDVKGDSGTIRGRVKDATTGQPIIGGYVEAIGTPYKTKTDLEGNYVLELPPGTYEVRLRSDANEPRRLSGVVVTKGSDETVNAELQPLAGANQVVAVKAEMNRESEGARLQQRKESAAARDILSRDAISKSGSGSTASVATRIVGATVIDGKYLFVRGLGHRYGNTLFDGARVPSPEPEVRTVPLDIFPSGALSAINVQKTFTPDVPGDFVGGSVQLESREIPTKLLFEMNVRAGVNTATTFQPIVHEGGFAGYDGLGFGNIPRALSKTLPNDYPANRGALDDDLQQVWTAQDIERFGEALYTDTRVRRGRRGPPNMQGAATVGYGFKPHDGGKLGFLASVSYRNQHQNYRERWKYYGVSESEENPGQYDLQPKVDYDGMRTVNNVQWSSVGLVKYEPRKDQKLSLTAFYSRDADDEVRQLEGISSTDRVLTTRLRYVMRSVLLTRLGGVHEIPKAKRLKIDWFGSYAQARRDDPTVRDMVYTDQSDGTGDPNYGLLGQGATNISLDLVDHTESGALNFTMLFKQWRQLEGKVKVGVWLEGKQRTFLVRRFLFQKVSDIDAVEGTGNIIVNNTIGGGEAGSAGGTEPYYVSENTQPFDSYRANQEVYATYAMLELPFVRWFRIAGGARFEANRQKLEPFDQFTGTTDAERGSRIRNNDVLPAVSFIFPTTDKMNVRLSGTQTVARPEFRELAPFVFSDFAGGITLQGQPGLKSAKIWNADLRWEWFPSAEEVVAVSVFYKHFEDPIERTINPGTSNLVSTFRNADMARNVGAEFEMRKNLEFLWKKLSNYSVGVNFAYVFSRVRLGETCNVQDDPDCDPEDALDVSTSRTRPLQGQAPFVANAYFDYDNKKSGTGLRLLYNTVLRSVAFVGGNNLPDIYLQPIHQLDFVGRQRIYKGLGAMLQVQNMLNWPIRWRQGREKALNYQMFPGATIMVGLSYEL
jgi:hypothetical protein